MKNKIISLLLCVVMMFSITSVLSGCGGNGNQAFVIMTDNLDGLFNPFYSTSASDGTIVSMTQIGMLTSGMDENGNTVVAFGPNEAVVTLDYASSYDSTEQSENPNKTGVTTYTFVIKNGLKYSDGEALTIEDVLFNMYVYLDPVYTGSSTMYSTDILGLSQYRTQQNLSGGASGDEWLTSAARDRASNRIKELINVFKQTAETSSGNYDTTEQAMRDAIAAWKLSEGYKQAVSNNTASVTSEQLLKDYEKTLELFRKELERDYDSAKDAYTDEPYKSNGFDEITSFMHMEGYVLVKFGDKDGKPNADKTVITEIQRYYPDSIKTKEDAIKYVYDSKINSELHIILSAWATATELLTLYESKAKEVILKENAVDGELAYPNISGIVSLGHTTNVETVEVNGTTYTVAHEHNENGTPKNPDEYDVLQIKINGIDPKAVWNFSFAVAPQHYYAEGYTVDIKENKFGVDYGSFDFMTDTIQSQRNVTVPMGAGAYMATNNKNADTVTGTEFFSSNVVYFKANPYFEESLEASLPEDSEVDYKVNIEKVRYQIVPANDALTMLQSGTVHYVTPQLTKENAAILDSIKSKGYEKIAVDQLGYGYIGINAGEIPNIYLRRAIMAAMDTSLALQYYDAGTAEQIFWPMSTVSWAYPKDANGNNKQTNGHSYPYIRFDEAKAIENIKSLMTQAYSHTMSYTESDLDITFTIAGSDLTDHPTYQVFQTAAKLLNECGWNVEVIADTQALTKLSTGSLAVWAAAWGTTVDPDMYQVYHKNSNASSVKAWGYNHILANESDYWMEMDILNKMSVIIDDARETDVQADRTALYEEAMGYVLDLAIELPVYQRKQLYAYNANVVDPTSFPDEINPYSSPLDRIWEIKLNEGAAASGSSSTGLAVGIAFGAVAVCAAVTSVVVYKKKKKRGYVIPIEEIDAEDLDAFNKFYKKRK
ncbi:MAG: hypothetical protein IJY23_01435 [Clostridia bacterium]|nr:hypothetical protein [Clostridia bacterium]